MEELLSVLKRLSVINRDNGIKFTNTERLDAIAELLRDGAYERIETGGLFHLYGKKAIMETKRPMIIVSSHVDCEHNITKCFCKLKSEDMLLGTFDNSITNSSIVSIMMKGNLPDNVLIAFTGDEEENGHGAIDLAHFIKKEKLDIISIIVLDVTEEGWETEANFTVENDFWDELFGESVIELINQTGCKWNYVPGEPDEIPDYIPKEVIIHVEAYEDESWDYDEENISCFSFCLPTKGEMHSDDGILARVSSYEKYTEVLEIILSKMAECSD